MIKYRGMILDKNQKYWNYFFGITLLAVVVLISILTFKSCNQEQTFIFRDSIFQKESDSLKKANEIITKEDKSLRDSISKIDNNIVINHNTYIYKKEIIEKQTSTEDAEYIRSQFNFTSSLPRNICFDSLETKDIALTYNERKYLRNENINLKKKEILYMKLDTVNQYKIKNLYEIIDNQESQIRIFEKTPRTIVRNYNFLEITGYTSIVAIIGLTAGMIIHNQMK